MGLPLSECNATFTCLLKPSFKWIFSKKFDVHANQIAEWKKQLDRAADSFDGNG